MRDYFSSAPDLTFFDAFQPDKLPKSLQYRAKAALHEMMNAPMRAECEKFVAAFVAEHEAKYPKARRRRRP